MSLACTISLDGRCLSEVDGIITGGTPGYDGHSLLSYVESWANRPTFHVGPVLPLQPGTSNFSESTLQAEREATPEGVGAKVSAFLDTALDRYGRCSIFYICFGSFFWLVLLTVHLHGNYNALSSGPRTRTICGSFWILFLGRGFPS